jgi:hypothetical protein
VIIHALNFSFSFLQIGFTDHKTVIISNQLRDHAFH